MSEPMEIEDVTDAIGDCLKGDGPTLSAAGFGIATLDIGEVYVRTPDGTTYRMALEEVSAEDVEGWGISFEG